MRILSLITFLVCCSCENSRPEALEERGVLRRSSFSQSHHIYFATQNWGSGLARETTRGGVHMLLLSFFLYHPLCIFPRLLYRLSLLLFFFSLVIYFALVYQIRKRERERYGVAGRTCFLISSLDWAVFVLYSFGDHFNEKRRRRMGISQYVYVCACRFETCEMYINWLYQYVSTFCNVVVTSHMCIRAGARDFLKCRRYISFLQEKQQPCTLRYARVISITSSSINRSHYHKSGSHYHFCGDSNLRLRLSFLASFCLASHFSFASLCSSFISSR